MTSIAIDYFATIGATNPLKYKGYSTFRDEEDSYSNNLAEIWNDAITDIIILSHNANPPDETWEVINTTIDGHGIKQNYPSIAVQRRLNSKRLDHIIDIIRITRNTKVPDGYELLSYEGQNNKHSSFDDNTNNTNTTSVDETVDHSMIRIEGTDNDIEIINETNTENQDDLDNIEETTEIYGSRSIIGFIAIKRSIGSDISFIQGLDIINDICFYYKSNDEDPPEGYKTLNISKLSRLDRITNKQKKYNEFMAYNMISGLGICDLRYDSMTIDRYPIEDHNGVALPMKELPMFAFPHDLRLKYSLEGRFPLPIFFTFVFTDTMGDHIYAACLRFYEKVPRNNIENIFKSIFGEENLGLLPEKINFYSPKVLCVISRNPYYSALRKYLCQLYSMSMSSLPCPIEYYIASVVNLVPNPVAGGRPFHIVQDAALISTTSKSMPPICLDKPPQRFFPHADLDFAGPCRCLSVDNVLAIFALMLREAKLIFMCNSHVMLTETMETFKALLFPLKWSSCFVTRLPFSLAGLLQAPGGFMIGIQVLENACCDIDESELECKSIHTSNIYALKRDYWLKNILPGTYVIDLSANLIFQFDGTNEIQLNQSKVNSLVHTLPLGPRARLYNKLDRISKKYQIGPQKTGRKHFDSVFDFHGEVGDADNVSFKDWKKFPTLDIRDSFMVLMIDILGDYQKYIIPPSEDMTANTYRTFQEAFYIEEYLFDGDDSMHLLLKSLLETQMFAVLLQQRAEASECSIVFYEQCASLLREIGLCAGGHGMLPHTHGPVHDMPAPLYKLKQARDIEHLKPSFQTTQWASLNSPTNRSSMEESSPRRLSSGSKIPLSPQSEVTDNYHLTHLLDIMNEMEINDSKIIIIDNKGESSSSNYKDELGNFNFNSLNDLSYGPLILPGPTKIAKEVAAKDVRRDEDGRFIYEGLWSNLDPFLLSEASKSFHPNIVSLRNYRQSHIENSNAHLTMMLRPFSERLTYMNSRQLCTRFRERILIPECAKLIGTYIDIVSTALLLLQIRVVSQGKPTSDVLQLLGLMAQLEDLNLLNYIEENVWRGILTCIGYTGGDCMRRIACVIYSIIEAYGITPDALTFGAYMKALSSTKMLKKDDLTGGQIDSFLFLEEIGLTWFIQRLALMKEASGTEEHFNSPTRSKIRETPQEKTENTLTSMLSVLRRPKKVFTPRSFTKKHVIVKLTGSASLVSTELSLKKTGLMSSFTPHGFFGCSFVRVYKDLAGPAESTVMDSISEWIAGVHTQATPHVISTPIKKYDKLAKDKDNRDSSVTVSTEFTETSESMTSSDSPIRRQFARMGSIMYNNSPNTSQLISSASKSLTFRTPSIFVSNNAESSGRKGGWKSRFGNMLNRMQGIDNETQASNSTDVELEVMTQAGVLANQDSTFSDDEDSASASGEEDTPNEITDFGSGNEEKIDILETLNIETNVVIETDNKNNDDNRNSESHLPGLVAADSVNPPADILPEEKTKDSPRNKRINILDVQTEIESLYLSDMTAKGYAIGIFSNIPCSCGYCLLDEEIQAYWTNHEIERDLTHAHDIICVNCQNKFSPQLQVNCYTKNDIEGKVDLVWKKLIPYVSPHYLRNELEQEIETLGNKMIDPVFVCESFPSLFWGILWYFTRLGLPSGFQCIPNPSENNEAHIVSRSPIAVGWRDSIVEKKVIDLLWNLKSPFEYITNFDDIFPNCSEDEKALSERFASSMDGSLAGMRTAMLQFAAENNMVDKIPGISKERKLYIGLLSIAHLHNAKVIKISNTNPVNAIHTIESGILFEKIFKDTITCNLSTNDMNTMNIKEESILNCSACKAAQAYRIAFSFLF